MAAWLAYQLLEASVAVFDNFLLVTLSPHFYNDEFVKVSWGVIRDFANIAFIFGIIIIGFLMIVGRSESENG